MRTLSVMMLLAAFVFFAGHASGSPPSDLSAADLQTQAAQGDADAQYNLGVLYEQGRGGPQDDAKARQWYEKAAAQGDTDAQYNLGMLYYQGQDVPQDNVRARMWWNLAALSGNADAMKYRDKVALRMTTRQVAEAQRLTRQCQARQFKGC